MQRIQRALVFVTLLVLLLNASLAAAQEQAASQVSSEPSGIEILMFLIATTGVIAAIGGILYLSRGNDQRS